MRLIDADALKKDWHMGDKCEDCQQDTRRCQYDADFTRMDICQMIDDAPTIGGWISVKDRLPGIDVNVLIFSKRYGIQKGCYDMNVWCVSGWGVMDGPITHWMPLPEPPKEDE